MTIRRIALTVLGFAGSTLAALVLCVSAQSILAEPAQPVFQTPAQPIQFPYAVPNTTLVIQSLTGYDGPFLEDGTDREVVDVAALLVRNTGAAVVESAYIKLQWEGGAYTFSGSYIPSGGTAVMLEQKAQPWQPAQFTHCRGSQTDVPPHRIATEITVTEEALGTVILTNSTEATIYGITIYYKTWLSQQDMYMGGITYAMDIPHLLPGQKLCVYPDHYAVGYSKVVYIQGNLQ